jgi:hypothetical protein
VEAGSQRPRQSPQSTTLVQVFIRQKWVEVPLTQEQTWKKFRMYIKRRFKLKQWQWRFEEQIEARSWCQKVPNPFTITAEKKHRIIMKGKKIRPHPGQGSGAAPHMMKEQRGQPRASQSSTNRVGSSVNTSNSPALSPPRP